MGITLTANNSKYSFDMGYVGFASLRDRICSLYDKELGEVYNDTYFCFSRPKEYTAKINEILADDRFKDEDADFIDFLFASDCEGKAGYRVAKKVYELLEKDSDCNSMLLGYVGRDDCSTYKDFKLFLRECYSHRRNFYWY